MNLLVGHLFKNTLILFYVHEFFAYICICILCACLPEETRRGYWYPWYWSHKWLQVDFWVLGLNVGPLEEQLLLLSIESILQPLVDQLIR